MTGADHPYETLTLRDGRVLAYAAYGDPAGAPVVHCHGTPSSRLDLACVDDELAAAGARAIAFDRPGLGRSTRKPKRVVADVVDDVRELADNLGLERFGVSGWSGGGPYALALAQGLPGRVARAAVCAGIAELAGGRDLVGLSSMDRRVLRWSTGAPLLARAYLAGIAGITRLRPADALRSIESESGPSDRAVLAALPGDARTKLAWFLEAFARGAAGAVDDYATLARAWGFELEAVACPVRLWQGDDDRFVPFEHAERQAALLADCELVRCPGEGHFLFLSRAAEIVGWAARGA